MNQPLETSTLRLNLGCGKSRRADWINIDRVPLDNVDVVADLEQCSSTPLPFEDNSVSEIVGSHVLEHIRNILDVMQELYRVAVPGAVATFDVPYGSSNDAFEDPTHCRAFFEDSWNYFMQPMYSRADYGYTGDWQPEQIAMYVHYDRFQGVTDETIRQRIYSERNIVLQMSVKLRCIKPARPRLRELMQRATISIQRVRLD
jgi:SAM-dependent methyltransferase